MTRWRILEGQAGAPVIVDDRNRALLVTRPDGTPAVRTASLAEQIIRALNASHDDATDGLTLVDGADPGDQLVPCPNPACSRYMADGDRACRRCTIDLPAELRANLGRTGITDQIRDVWAELADTAHEASVLIETHLYEATRRLARRLTVDGLSLGDCDLAATFRADTGTYQLVLTATPRPLTTDQGQTA